MIDLIGTLRRLTASVLGITTDTTTIAADVAGLDGDTMRGTDDAALAADLEHVDFGDSVYYESGAPTGTAYPLGTPTNPVGSIPNAKTIADALNLNTIFCHGVITLAAAMEHYNFISHRHGTSDLFNLGGQDVDNSFFEGLVLNGAQGGTGYMTVKDCFLYAVTGISGFISNSAFYTSTFQFKDGGSVNLDSCYSIFGTVTITVQAPTASIKDYIGRLTLTAQDGGTLGLGGYKGQLEIDAMTAGTLTVMSNGANITINADCTGGTINLHGNAQVTGAGGGVTINNYLLDTKVDDLLDNLALDYHQTHSRTRVYPQLPSSVITITTAAAADTFGSWTQVVPIDTIDFGYTVKAVMVEESGAAATYIIQFGYSTVDGTAPTTAQIVGEQRFKVIGTPIKNFYADLTLLGGHCPANSKIWGRLKSETVNTDTVDISLVITRLPEITNPVTPVATWPWNS